MNQRLKQLAESRGMNMAKLQHLVSIIGEDGAEDVILQAQETEKTADAEGVAYKAAPARRGYDMRRDLLAIAAGADQLRQPRAATTAKPTSLKTLIENALTNIRDIH